MTQETEHTEFEKEAKKYGLDSRRAAGAYYDSQTMTAFCLWQTARARGGRGEVDRAFDDGARFAIAMKSTKPVEVGEVETHITDMAIAHDMSHTAFCDEGYWRDEFISAQEKAIAALPAKPVEADKELTRLKRQVEVLREAMHSLAHDEFAAVGFRMDVARKALAAADRIAKGEV